MATNFMVAEEFRYAKDGKNLKTFTQTWGTGQMEKAWTGLTMTVPMHPGTANGEIIKYKAETKEVMYGLNMTEDDK